MALRQSGAANLLVELQRVREVAIRVEIAEALDDVLRQVQHLAHLAHGAAAAVGDDVRDLGAMKALAAGHASDSQQKRVLEWLIQICQTYENPYRPGGRSAERASQFACGKQFIGQQIVKLINMPMAGAESSEQGEQG